MHYSTEDMTVGQIWAYRKGGRSPLKPVEILQLGGKRVYLQHLDDAAEGLIEWVPAGRLKCEWSGLGAFMERERRWDALAEPHPGNRAESNAAETVFLELAEEIAEMAWSANGHYCTIRDLKQLTEITGVSASWIIGHEEAFIEDGVLYAPWPVTKRLAQALAPKFANDLLRAIEGEEARESESRLERGITKEAWLHPDVDGDDRWLAKVGLWRAAKEEERKVLRNWIGEGEPARADANQRMNQYLVDLVALARRASAELPGVRTKRALTLRDEIDALVKAIAHDLW